MNPLPLETHWTNERIRAWRIWAYDRVKDEPSSITSFWGASPAWQREMPAATHTMVVGRHEQKATPAHGCMCGYWSLKPEHLDDTETKHWPWDVRPIINVGLIGWVDQWGIIEEHEHGYRSQFIKIDSFIQLSEDWVRQWYPTDWLDHRSAYGLYVGRTHRQAAAFDVPVVQHG